MEKLELKHLSPYLPYGLSVKCMGEYMEDSDEDNPTPKLFELIGLLKNKASVSFHGNKEVFHYEDLFPILRPLSDLTKEIEIDGKRFVSNQYLKDNYIGEMMHTNLASWSHRVVSKLFEWHFDVFGLIEKGLAIDINTL